MTQANVLLNALRTAQINHLQCPRAGALSILQITDPALKTAATLALARVSKRSQAWQLAFKYDEPSKLPGAPAELRLVHATALKMLPLHTPQGRGVLLHALAHIELNAVNLALDAVWRFPNMPLAYYQQWLAVARDEAYHYRMLARRMALVGVRYGDHPAHNSLWDMAQKTRGSALARMALVPRLHEARGLDAAPAVREKLIGCGDAGSGAVVAVILRDEVGHVAVGNHWFNQLCAAQGLEPMQTYASLCNQYQAPILRPPFNLEARRAAGFTDAELLALVNFQAKV